MNGPTLKQSGLWWLKSSRYFLTITTVFSQLAVGSTGYAQERNAAVLFRATLLQATSSLLMDGSQMLVARQ
jgi:hypothetical protein